MVKTLALRLAGAVLIPLAALAVTAGTATASASASTQAVAPVLSYSPRVPFSPAVTCNILGHFDWRQVGVRGYPLGLTQFKIITNNCRDHVRAAMVCVYIGPHAAQIRVLRAGGWVVGVNAVTRTTCQTYHIYNIQWSLGHAAAGGIQYYGSGGPGIHTKWFVGG